MQSNKMNVVYEKCFCVPMILPSKTRNGIKIVCWLANTHCFSSPVSDFNLNMRVAQCCIALEYMKYYEMEFLKVKI